MKNINDETADFLNSSNEEFAQVSGHTSSEQMFSNSTAMLNVVKINKLTNGIVVKVEKITVKMK